MKKISIWIAISICLCFVLKVRAQDITTGLVAHYEFENTSGDVIDAAGSHNGTNNGATRGVSGKVGNAFSFDGGHYITINNHSDITNYASFTLSAWVYPTALSSNKTIISKVSPNRDFNLKFSGSNIEAHFAYGSNYYHCTSTSTATINSWIHVVATWQNNQWNIYYNGVLDHTCNFTTDPPWSGGLMQIGAMSNSEIFVGLIDEVRVYNRALSSTDVTALYNYTGGGTLPALSIDANVSCNEGDGTIVLLVNASQASASDMTFDYTTVDGTATAGSDYTARSGTYTIPAGFTNLLINVPIIDDTSVESDETFTLTISNPTNATIANATGTITIEDNDFGSLTCPNTISNYPYSESFESSSNTWVDALGDDLNWTHQSGGTGSGNTGPTAAQEGSYYYYIEASSPNYPEKTAILESSCFDLTGKSSAEFSFYYHMYGSSMGTLTLEARTDGTDWISLWSNSGDQGNQWLQTTVNLSSYLGDNVKLRFYGTTGSGYTSDIAVDNITVTTSEGGGSGFWAQSGTDIYSTNSGNVGIGTSSPDEKLTVNGTIHSEEVIVDLSIPAPDYVFDKEYGVMTISELKTFLEENSHLPEFPSASEMEENGINLSEINMSLLKRIEELTLYILDQEKRILEIEKQYSTNNKKQ
nr:LamG-like jellyroll fold domain-containing protein [uncultured Draconibacterium sp.]